MPKTNEYRPHLSYGLHTRRSDGMCALEWVAYLAGEPHSDRPECVSPVLRQVGIALNDRLSDRRRQLLGPYLVRMIGTAGDGRDEERRELCRQWLAEQLPALFDRAGLTDRAAQLREAPGALTDEAARRLLREANKDAWEARVAARKTLRERVREELAKRDIDWSKFGTEQAAAAEVAAVAAAAVVEVAAAAEVAAVAAEVAAAAAAEAVAAEAAAATATAAAAAAAAAAEAAVAAAEAAAAAAEAAGVPGSSRYWAIRNRVYAAIRDQIRPKIAETIDPDDALLKSFLAVLDRMLPESPLQQPAVEDAAEMFSEAA